MGGWCSCDERKFVGHLTFKELNTVLVEAEATMKPNKGSFDSIWSKLLTPLSGMCHMTH